MLASSGLNVTEYMTFKMNSADNLVCLHQGNHSIEDYVEDFCGLCHQVDFNDTFLKDIFHFGMDKHLTVK